MPNKSDIVNCKGSYHERNKCRVFRLPKDETKIDKCLPYVIFLLSYIIFLCVKDIRLIIQI